MTMKLLLCFIAILALSGNSYAAAGPEFSQIDRQLFDASDIVIRAHILDDAGGSKYWWVSIEVLSVFKAPHNVTLPSRMSIAYLSIGPKLPSGVATLYLVPYNPEKPEYGWKLLQRYDDKSKTLSKGYSHYAKE